MLEFCTAGYKAYEASRASASRRKLWFTSKLITQRFVNQEFHEVCFLYMTFSLCFPIVKSSRNGPRSGCHLLGIWKPFLGFVVLAVIQSQVIPTIYSENQVSPSNLKPLRVHDQPPKFRLLMEWQRSFKRNGLGNQLFWFASLIAIAARSNLIPVIPAYNPLHDVFDNLSTKTVTDKEYDWLALNARDLPEHQVYSKICCIYLPFTEKLGDFADTDMTLRGAFQSYKYFHPESESLVKQKLAFKPRVLQEARRILQSLEQHKKQSSTRVGIHVRKGDVDKTHLRHFGHKSAPKSYFDKARAYLEDRYKNILYTVSSNDLPWARTAVTGDNVVYIEDSRPEVTLAAMTQMDHLILSVGTFSWWIGYLSNATEVIYYNGTPQPGSFYDVTFRAEDYWLPQWKSLSD